MSLLKYIEMADFNFIRVTSDDDFVKFHEKADGFHDSICHEMRLLFDGRVFQDGRMCDSRGYHIFITFHSQSIKKCPVIEIFLWNVKEFKSSNISDVLVDGESLGAVFSQDDIELGDRRGKLFVKADEFYYRILPEENLPQFHDQPFERHDILSRIEPLANIKMDH